MITYIYTEHYGKTKKNGGRNVEITVYRVKDNLPEIVGYETHDTAGWTGARIATREILRDELGIPMTDKGNLVDEDNVRIVALI